MALKTGALNAKRHARHALGCDCRKPPKSMAVEVKKAVKED